MSVVVRRVGPEAAPEVHAVMAAAFGARPVLDPPADALGDDVAAVERLLEPRGGLLACVDDRPVGCLVLHPGPAGMVLRRFGVHPDAQGHGVAGALVAAAVDAALGHPALIVLAREELPSTIEFWQRHQFVESDRRPPYVELRRPLPTVFEAEDAVAMRSLGQRLGQALAAGDLVLLSGELGAGKTTFTQGVGEGLEVRGGVTSPTFVIARVHPSLVAGPALVHVDAYRLGGIDELDDLDLDTGLESAVTVVEWGAGVAEGLADSHLAVTIERRLADEVVGDSDPRRVEMRWRQDQ